MTLHIATSQQIDSWDDFIAENPDGGNVFQSAEIAETKRRGGWLPHYIFADEVAITVLEKKLPLLGSYFYIPKGPGVNHVSDVAKLLPELNEFAQKNSAFALKIEPEILESPENHAKLRRLGLVHTPAVQPNVSTVIINLAPPLDDIMASLNQKGRHAIHRAERDGVVTKPVELNKKNARTMFNLLSQTAEGRFESSVRDFDYYFSFWQGFVRNGRGQLFFAYLEDKVVAAAYCMYLGKKGLYKDGASVRKRTAYGASHLLQWEVIKWMKSQGVTSYDLCGAPHSSHINSENHPFYGIGRFKTSFNKQVTDYVGAYDIPIKPRAYRLWQKFGQRLVVSLNYRLKHSQWF